jgi:hypothetical protein
MNKKVAVHNYLERITLSQVGYNAAFILCNNNEYLEYHGTGDNKGDYLFIPITEKVKIKSLNDVMMIISKNDIYIIPAMLTTYKLSNHEKIDKKLSKSKH